MSRLAISLAVVGVSYPNKRGPSRLLELGNCQPGESVELRPEPDNPADEHAIAVYSCRGIQIGYLPSERAVFVGSLIRHGTTVSAIFQERTHWGAVVRLAFDGEQPVLPPRTEMHDPDAFAPDTESHWYPDDDRSVE